MDVFVLIELFMLGLALSCDSFAVTVSNTLVCCAERKSRLMVMPVLFGLFQGGMPVLGYYLGAFVGDIIERYSGIVALALLAVIGGNMVREGVKALLGHGDEPPADACATEAGRSAAPRLRLGAVVVEAFATAIDAFVVGVSLYALGANIWLAGAVIALVTFGVCMLGILIGRRVGPSLGDKAQVLGGLVLIFIGLKAFFG